MIDRLQLDVLAWTHHYRELSDSIPCTGRFTIQTCAIVHDRLLLLRVYLVDRKVKRQASDSRGQNR